jgi:hypothetical protein
MDTITNDLYDNKEKVDKNIGYLGELSPLFRLIQLLKSGHYSRVRELIGNLN